MSQMLTDIDDLRHALYSRWQMVGDSDDEETICIFCGAINGYLSKETHTRECVRLEYLQHYYNIVPRESRSPKTSALFVDGGEFTRSGIYAWYTTDEEFWALIHQALLKDAGDRWMQEGDGEKIMQRYRLPSGTYTDNLVEYREAWHALIDPLCEIADAELLTYDPDILLKSKAWRTEPDMWQRVELPAWFAIRLVEKLKEEKHELSQ